MNKAVIGGVVGLLALGGAAYGYMSYKVDSEIKEAIGLMNSNPDMPYEIEYGDIDTSLFSNSVSLKDIVAHSKRRKGFKVLADEATVVADGFLSGDVPTVISATVSNISAKGNGGDSLSLKNISFEDLDLRVFDTVETAYDFDRIPIQKFELNEFNFQLLPQKLAIKIDTARLATNGAFRLEELLLDNFLIVALEEKTNVKVGTIHLQGGDFTSLRTFPKLSAANVSETSLNTAAIEEMAGGLADAALNYFGIQSYKIADIHVDTPEGITVSLDNFELKDLERQFGMVTGATIELADFKVDNIQKASPQAEQLLQIAELNTLVVNMAAKSAFDSQDKKLKSNASLTVDNMFNFTADTVLNDVDLEKMASQVRAATKMQYTQMFKDLQQQALARSGNAPAVAASPEEEMDKMLDMLAQAYTGYFSTFNASMLLEDTGLTERGLKVQSAMTGVPAEQLREQMVMMLTMQLTQLLGPDKQEEIAAAVNGFLAPQSTPIVFAASNKKPFVKEALLNMNAANWQELIDLSIASKTEGTAASSN